jgi:hypothetical protein
MVVHLRVRRFFCEHDECEVKTFVEQVAGLTVLYSRRTVLLAGMLESIGLALAGRAGSRLAAGLGLQVGRNALLRLVRALPDPDITTVSALGVDLSRSWDYPEARAGPARVRWWRADPGCFGRPRSG